MTLTEDAPERIDVARFIGGLVDMALILGAYTVRDGTIECSRCLQSMPLLDGVTTLEFLNVVLDHNEQRHHGQPPMPTTG